MRYGVLTKEQQDAYDRLPKRRQKYVDFRAQGYGKAQAYRMAGYTATQSNQAGYILEAHNPVIKELVATLQGANKIKSIIEDPKSKVNRQINELAGQKNIDRALATLDGMSEETARRVAFYRDIINGKITTVKKVSRYNERGNIIETRVEETSDVSVKMQARKELDRILGVNEIIDLDQFQMGPITINIVDASKKEQAQESENSVELDPNNVKIVDGQQVLVTEEKNVKARKKKDKGKEKGEENGNNTSE